MSESSRKAAESAIALAEWHAVIDLLRQRIREGAIPSATLGDSFARICLARLSELEKEHDGLRARLEAMASQEQVAWQCRFTNSIGWDRCTQEHHDLVRANPAAWPDYEVRALCVAVPKAAR